MSLKEYQRKRKFDQTPEPAGEEGDAPAAPLLRFVVQKHRATRMHYDLRLEMGGVYKSWAVPKRPTLDASEQRLAVEVEDHPLSYGAFEGVIPKGNYGAGTVMIWDAGTVVERSSSGREDSETRLLRGLEEGHVTFVLSGSRLAGEFALVKLKKGEGADRGWLLLKKRDAYALSSRAALAAAADDGAGDRSAATGRTMDEIAREAPTKGEVWIPGKGPLDAAQLKETLVAGAPPPAAAAMAEAPRPRPKATRAHKTPDAPTLARVEDAPKERLPRGLKPMLPAHATTPPDEKGWLYSPRLGGVRVLAEVTRGSAKLFSRQRLPLDAKHPDVVRSLKALGRDAVLDGEIADGRFHLLDILHLDGRNLRALPLRARLEAAAGLELPSLPAAEGLAAARAVAARIGAEGLLARHADSLYESGTSAFWLKLPLADGAESAESATASVAFTNLEKVLFPDDGYTKGDVVAYYRTVAAAMLPYLVNRPQSMHRHPNGILMESFFQKDASGYKPPFVSTTRVESASSGRSIDYLLCQNEATLLYMANLGCLEINPWLAAVPRLDEPTYSVIDLDPDAQTFDEVVDVASAVKDELDRARVPGFLKTSGASGLHVYVPLAAGADFDRARELAEIVVRRVETRLPQITTTERNPAKRRGRLYLDYMQNRRGQTLAAPYCIRPRPKAPVSTPLTWDELVRGLSPEAFTIATMPARLERVGDLWSGLMAAAEPVDELLARLRP